MSLPRRQFLKTLGLFGTFMAAENIVTPRARASDPAPAEQRPGTRPNFLIIVTDDQRADSFTRTFMPHTWKLIVDQGLLFTRGYVTTPLCGPSRASILTGMYSRHHGALRNEDLLARPTIVDQLQEKGYYTGLVGKYLNAWEPPAPRPEFDFWAATPRGTRNYQTASLNVKGVKLDLSALQHPVATVSNRPPRPILPSPSGTMALSGYITDILRDYAVQFLRQAPGDRPFFLLFAPIAPHAPAVPAPGHETLYSDLPLYRPPNFNELDMSGKPRWLQALPLMDPRTISEVDLLRINQLRALKALDEAIADLLLFLEAQGRQNRTLVVFISDNGMLLGEHRLFAKARAYEAAVRVPFALRYPPLVTRPRVESRLVANIDLAPTIYDLAGLPIPSDADGRSLMPLLHGTTTWRDALLIESWENRPFMAIHTERYVYIETDQDRPELYDLATDPDQLHNVVTHPAYAGTLVKLQQQSIELRRDDSEKHGR